jgi:hypothetical protein
VYTSGPDWLAQAIGLDPIGCKQVKSRTGVHYLITGYMGHISLQHIQQWVPGATQSVASDRGFTLCHAWYPLLNMLQGNMSHIPGDKIVHTSS